MKSRPCSGARLLDVVGGTWPGWLRGWTLQRKVQEIQRFRTLQCCSCVAGQPVEASGKAAQSVGFEGGGGFSCFFVFLLFCCFILFCCFVSRSCLNNSILITNVLWKMAEHQWKEKLKLKCLKTKMCTVVLSQFCLETIISNCSLKIHPFIFFLHRFLSTYCSALGMVSGGREPGGRSLSQLSGGGSGVTSHSTHQFNARQNPKNSWNSISSFPSAAFVYRHPLPVPALKLCFA